MFLSAGSVRTLLDENEDSTCMRIRRRRLRDLSNVLDMPDSDFNQNFRMNKEVFVNILNEVDPNMKMSFRITAVPPIMKLALFINFLATGSHQKSIGNGFAFSMSQAKVSLVIAECLELFETHFCPKWIQLEMAEEESKTKEHFYTKFGIPGVVGCVDGTHVRIKCPSEDSKHLYYNRNGFYSINAMIICDQNLTIRYIDARHPGANHDAVVWKTSGADDYFKTQFSAGKKNTWLFGDSGYQLLPYLMTPFRNPSDSCEERFNEQMRKARKSIERCFGVLKNRFRCIIGKKGLYYSPKMAIKIINVCSAIHNTCIFYKNNLPPLQENNDDSQENNDDPQIANDDMQDLSTVAINIRRQIAESLILKI